LCDKILSTKTPLNVLEIGAAGGHFLNLVKQKGHQVTGCDLSESQCKAAHDQYGINIINSDVKDLDIKEKFDVIFMFQLFEHISDPCDFLYSVCQLLKQDGYLILDVPNINEALYRLYKIPKIVNSFFFKQQHPFTYSVTGLKALFKQFSLKPIKTELVQNYN